MREPAARKVGLGTGVKQPLLKEHSVLTQAG